MPKAPPIESWPEVVHTRSLPRGVVARAVATGKLRPLGLKLYTTNFTDPDATIIARSRWRILGLLVPQAVLSERTNFTLQPTADGTVFAIGPTKYHRDLAGLKLRVAKGPSPLDTDVRFVDDLYIASRPRAFLESLKQAPRPRGGIARSLTKAELEAELEKILNTGGEAALNRLRDDARALVPALDAADAYTRLAQTISMLLGSRPGTPTAATAVARLAGAPYDADRVTVFEALFARLRAFAAPDRPGTHAGGPAFANVSFFDAYFSNFIEGTEFEVDEARAIVFDGHMPAARPDDAKDILGTYRIAGDLTQMRVGLRDLPTVDAFIDRVRTIHVAMMTQRPDKRPGLFKERPNRAGDTHFVQPAYVLGTLRRAYDLVRALDHPFQRATAVMFMLSDVHPFDDGNGRVARALMNAELVAGGQARILIPTVYRFEYLDGLRTMSRQHHPEVLIAVLEYAQRMVAGIDWTDFSRAEQQLTGLHAFAMPSPTERLLQPR